MLRSVVSVFCVTIGNWFDVLQVFLGSSQTKKMLTFTILRLIYHMKMMFLSWDIFKLQESTLILDKFFEMMFLFFQIEILFRVQNRRKKGLLSFIYKTIIDDFCLGCWTPIWPAKEPKCLLKRKKQFRILHCQHHYYNETKLNSQW